MAQAADAIGAAHAAGIIHRDVKPANLLVTPDRRVKITDFGIARATEGMALTQTGQVMGTPQYLSPEQAQGGRATPASDVYSLGVVTFECLTGRRPFTGESPVATALAQIREPVPPLPASVPRDLAAVVTRAMAKEPAERFADGTAYAAALREPATVAEPYRRPSRPRPPRPRCSPQPPPPPVRARSRLRYRRPAGPHRSRGPVAWVLLALVVAAAIVALIWVASQGDDPDEQTEEPRPAAVVVAGVAPARRSRRPRPRRPRRRRPRPRPRPSTSTRATTSVATSRTSRASSRRWA